MPGASLWLVPPNPHHLLHHNGHHHGLHLPHLPHPHLPGSRTHSRKNSREIENTHNHQGSIESKPHHKIHETLTDLVTKTIPSTFPGSPHPPAFVPHVTLTSDINLSALKPSPAAWLERLAIPQVEDVVVRFTSVDVGSSFTKKLFLRCDKTGLEGLGELCRWQAVESPNGIGGEEERKRAETWAETIWEPHVSLLYSDIQVSEEQRREVEGEVIKSGISFDGTGDLSGWKSGTIWLVDTSLPIDQWKPIAERKLVAEEDI